MIIALLVLILLALVFPSIMRFIGLILLLIVGAITLQVARAENVPVLVDGKCTSASHLAEGKIGADLSKLQSAIHCDTMIIHKSTAEPGRVMITFLMKAANHGRVITFAGLEFEPHDYNIQRVYFEPGNPTPVQLGYCGLKNDKNSTLSMFCTAKNDEDGNRSVVIIAFRIKDLRSLKDF